MSAEDKRILARMKEERELLTEFGAKLHGSDPGVTAYFADVSFGRVLGTGGGYFGEPLNFSAAEWKWLRPLLEELRDFRNGRATSSTKSMTADLFEVAAAYGPLTAQQVEFLTEHAHIVSLLMSAIPLVRAVFGENTQVSLDMLGAPHLYLLIHTKLSWKEVAPLDKEFEQKWIAAVPSETHSLLTPTIEFDQ